MKFTTDRDSLMKAVGHAKQATVAATAHYYGHELLGAIRMTVLKGGKLVCAGSDGKTMSIKSAIDVTKSKQGRVFAPANLLSPAIKALPDGPVDVSSTGEVVKIAGEFDSFDVRVMQPPGGGTPGQTAEIGDDPGFELIPRPESDPITVSSEELWQGIRQVVPAASADEARPILTGVMLESADDGASTTLAATDSYRLHIKELGAGSGLGAGAKALMPAKAMKELLDLVDSQESGTSGPVQCRLGERSASFDIDEGRVSVTVGLIEGDYPNWRGLVPGEDGTGRITVDRSEMQAAVKRAQVMALDSAPVQLSVEGGRLFVSAQANDAGSSRASAATKSEGTVDVAFNPGFLLDGLNSLGGDEITLRVYGEDRPTLKPTKLQSPSDPACLVLLMPVRVS